MPSFFGDVQFEKDMAMQTAQIVTDIFCYTDASIKRYTLNTAHMAAHVGAHILWARLNNKDAVIFSNGLGAFTSNWIRFDFYMNAVTEQYGEIGFAFRLPNEATTDEEREICPEQDSGFSYEVSTSKQLVERILPGVAIFKKDSNIIAKGNDQMIARSYRPPNASSFFQFLIRRYKGVLQQCRK